MDNGQAKFIWFLLSCSLSPTPRPLSLSLSFADQLARHFWHRTWQKLLVFLELLGLDTKTTTAATTRCAERQKLLQLCKLCATCNCNSFPGNANWACMQRQQQQETCQIHPSDTKCLPADATAAANSLRSPSLAILRSLSPARLSAIVIIDLWQDD